MLLRICCCPQCRFLELRDYILKRKEELRSESTGGQTKKTAKGFA
jgi:hypothetical protein